MNKKILFILISVFVLVIGFFFSFYKLGTVLSGFPTDDAGLGYAAYSILKTGKDEFGKSFPVLLRSQGDFRTPVYTYLIIPFIKVFGLTIFSIRLPSALFGFLTIPALFFLVLELSRSRRLALLASLLFSISPWHIIFSRNAFDNNLSIFFMVLGFYLLFKSFNKPKLMILSSLVLGISIVAYRVEQIIIPITLLAVFIKYQKIFLEKNRRKYLIFSLIILILVCLPIIMLLDTPAYWIRAKVLGIFDPLIELRNINFSHFSSLLFSSINNSGYQSLRILTETYFLYFSPRFINALGDYLNKPTYLELPAFFIWQIPFYIWGIIALIREKGRDRLRFFTFLILLLFPIPAALARDPLSPMRALQMVIPQTIIVSFGLNKIFSNIRNRFIKCLIYLAFVLVVIYSIADLYATIFLLGSSYKQNSREWGWGKVSYSIQNLHSNIPIVVNDPEAGIYLQLAFFLGYDPANYQKENFEVSVSEYYTNLYHNPERRLGNITVRQINWNEDPFKKEYLVADISTLTDQIIADYKLVLISEIKYWDGSTVFRIVKTNIQ